MLIIDSDFDGKTMQQLKKSYSSCAHAQCKIGLRQHCSVFYHAIGRKQQYSLKCKSMFGVILSEFRSGTFLKKIDWRSYQVAKDCMARCRPWLAKTLQRAVTVVKARHDERPVQTVLFDQESIWCMVLTFWHPLLPYGYSYKASCARPG